MNIFLFATLILLPFLFLFLAALCSAIQDVVKHKCSQSVFYDKGKFNFLVLGTPYEFWWNCNGKDWLAAYNFYNQSMGKRKTKILFLKIHTPQIYNAWHFFKTLKIGFNILADVAATVVGIFVNINLQPVWWMWLIAAAVYFLFQSLNWNMTFNYFYDKKLIKKEFRGKQ